jgi:hypothetical protein
MSTVLVNSSVFPSRRLVSTFPIVLGETFCIEKPAVHISRVLPVENWTVTVPCNQLYTLYREFRGEGTIQHCLACPLYERESFSI